MPLVQPVYENRPEHKKRKAEVIEFPRKQDKGEINEEEPERLLSPVEAFPTLVGIQGETMSSRINPFLKVLSSDYAGLKDEFFNIKRQLSEEYPNQSRDNREYDRVLAVNALRRLIDNHSPKLEVEFIEMIDRASDDYERFRDLPIKAQLEVITGKDIRSLIQELETLSKDDFQGGKYGDDKDPEAAESEYKRWRDSLVDNIQTRFKTEDNFLEKAWQRHRRYDEKKVQQEYIRLLNSLNTQREYSDQDIKWYHFDLILIVDYLRKEKKI